MHRPFAALIVLSFACPFDWVASCAHLLGAEPTAAVCDRAHDQLWLVNTRHLDCAALACESPPFQIHHCVDGQWRAADSSQFFARSMRTVIFVHGNRVDSCQAQALGQMAYRELVACGGNEPVRFVIWSWCSDRLRRPLKDVRVKADRADDEAVLFGRFLGRFSAEDEVGLIGFSYGARIITGGLHLVGGGSWQGHAVAAPAPARFHVALWAAAMNHDWLQPGNCHDRALIACRDWLNIVNPCDPALKLYPHLDRSCRGQALGYAGLAKHCSQCEAAGFRECTAEHLVGRSHSSESYLCSAGVMHETRQVVLNSSGPRVAAASK